MRIVKRVLEVASGILVSDIVIDFDQEGTVKRFLQRPTETPPHAVMVLQTTSMVRVVFRGDAGVDNPVVHLEDVAQDEVRLTRLGASRIRIEERTRGWDMVPKTLMLLVPGTCIAHEVHGRTMVAGRFRRRDMGDLPQAHLQHSLH